MQYLALLRAVLSDMTENSPVFTQISEGHNDLIYLTILFSQQIHVKPPFLVKYMAQEVRCMVTKKHRVIEKTFLSQN